MLGLLYDVHGNLPALEAVLADCPAERFLLGGDHVGFGGWPRETADLLRGLDAEWIRGNVDRWLVDAPDAPDAMRDVIERSRALAGPDLCRELAALPESVTHGETHFCHASPLSDMAGFYPDEHETDAERLAGSTAARVVFGHTHLQFRRSGPGGVDLVNPGSVGIPLDGDRRAAYALIDEGSGSVELTRVEYDWRRAADAVRERVGELPAKRIEQARFDVT